MKLNLNALISQLIKYGLVSIVMLFLSLVTFYITFEIFDFPLYITYVIVYFCAIYVSYLLNSKFTFGKKYSKNSALKYYLVYIIGLVIGLFLIYLVNQYLHQTKFFTIILIIIPRSLLTFILSKFFVFN